MKQTCGIYIFRNKVNNKIYVGKSIHIETRYRQHMNCNNLKYPLYRAFAKYGVNSFDFSIIHRCKKEQLDYWETFYIRYYCSNDLNYGYNLTKGGEGMSGYKWSDESKLNQSIRRKEYLNDNPISKETKDKLSSALIGVTWDEERKKNHSKALQGHAGHKWTEEERVHHSNKMQEYYSKQENHDKMSNSITKAYEQHPEMRKKQSEKRKEYYKTHECHLSKNKGRHWIIDKETNKRVWI